MDIGKRIKARREELGMTQEQLAEKMGYRDKSNISRVENGKHDVSQTKINKYAEILHTSPSYLMGWTEERHEMATEKIEQSNRIESYAKKIASVSALDVLDAYRNADEKTQEIIRLILRLEK